MKQLPLRNYHERKRGNRKSSDSKGAQGYSHRVGNKMDRNQELERNL